MAFNLKSVTAKQFEILMQNAFVAAYKDGMSIGNFELDKLSATFCATSAFARSVPATYFTCKLVKASGELILQQGTTIVYQQPIDPNSTAYLRRAVSDQLKSLAKANTVVTVKARSTILSEFGKLVTKAFTDKFKDSLTISNFALHADIATFCATSSFTKTVPATSFTCKLIRTSKKIVLLYEYTPIYRYVLDPDDVVDYKTMSELRAAVTKQLRYLAETQTVEIAASGDSMLQLPEGFTATEVIMSPDGKEFSTRWQAIRYHKDQQFYGKLEKLVYSLLSESNELDSPQSSVTISSAEISRLLLAHRLDVIEALLGTSLARLRGSVLATISGSTNTKKRIAEIFDSLSNQA